LIEQLEERVMLSADGFIKAAGTVLRDGHGTGDAVLLQGRQDALKITGRAGVHPASVG